ncbi:MAG: hypothetical protein HGB31_01980 [Erysipelotrichaceae bacterium]|nr:hypothetical protein [Erysipelotrichaceae bacterium]
MKLKLTVLAFLAVLLISSLSAAALTSLSIDRTVESGTVLADTNANVAVKFAAGTGYASVLSESADGKVAFDLSKLLVNSANGFNTDAQFQIGTALLPVFVLTNNSDDAVTVALSGATGGLVLVGSASVASGASANYYFTIDSTGIAKSTAIGGTIQVR